MRKLRHEKFISPKTPRKFFSDLLILRIHFMHIICEGRPPGELGVSKFMECNIFPLQCFDIVGWATGRASGL